MGTLSYLARRFVAGEQMEDAVDAVRTLNSEGLIATLDVLGENVSNQKEALAAADEYIELLHAIQQHKLESNVSLKLTQMGLDIGNEFCLKNVKNVIDIAGRQNNFVRLDIEGSPYTERTLDIFRQLYKSSKHVGCALQAYLYRSEEDAMKLAKIKAPVRVCKGAYKEPASIAFQNMDDIRRSFKTMVEILLKAGSKVGIATHDEKIITWAVQWVEENKIPRNQFEFQMLYGLRRKRGKQLAAQGYVVRSYVPYGTHWFPYFVRRLRERKENIFFVLRSLVAD